MRRDCQNRGRMNVVTCSDEELSRFIADVNGLTMDNIHLSGQAFSFPQVIPVIPRGMFSWPSSSIPSDIVGVCLDDILTKPIRQRAGRYILPVGSTINPLALAAPVFHGKRVVLFSTGRDIMIETLWWERHDMHLFETLTQMGFVGITGMNFSIIAGECPCAHALNIKKSLCYCQELSNRGVWTIPHVYAENPYQRERWVRLLRRQPHIKLVTMNSQLQRMRVDDMHEFFETVRALIENTDVSILIQGRATGMPKDLRPYIAKRMHFAVSGPCKNAMIFKDKPVAEHLLDFNRVIWSMSEDTLL